MFSKLQILFVLLCLTVYGYSQQSIHLSSLLPQMNDYPVDFRSFLSQQLNFKLVDEYPTEGGVICYDEFQNNDSIKIIKGYYSTTILASKGVGFEKYVHYIRGTESFLPNVYKRISTTYLNPDSIALKPNDWEKIQIDNLTEAQQKDMLSEVLNLGAIEGNGCTKTIGSDDKCYVLNNLYHITFQEYLIDSKRKYSIEFYKN